MNREDRTIIYNGLQTYLLWRFREYIVRHRTRDLAAPLQSAPLIDNFSLDADYQDFYVGFSITHYGRRGDNAIFFRIGAWGDMIEIFHQAYYRDRDATDYTKCDSSDPIACVYDLPIVAYETRLVSRAADISVDAETFSHRYLSMPCLATNSLI